MPYTSLTASRFGGLNLTADPTDLGLAGAIDLSNVEIGLGGSVRTRPGCDKTSTSTTTLGAYPWLVKYDTQGGPLYTLAGGAAGTRTYSNSFASYETHTLADTATYHAVQAGTRIYIIGAADLHYIDPLTPVGVGTSGVVAAGTQGTCLAIQSPDERLMIGNADGSWGRVRFSAPGDPESYTADDYVNVADGFPLLSAFIMALVSWRDLSFAFFNDRFHIFYGNSTDSTGGAVFNYRAVKTGVGCADLNAACAAQDGVYFIHSDGVYRTTGGAPELVSGSLQPFFDGRTNGYFAPTGPLTSPRIHAADDRLYVWQQGSTGMFVMDLRSREWTYWVLSTAPYALLPLPDPREFLFVNSTGQLHRFSPDFTDDDGTAIASYYLSGFQTVADGRSARLRNFPLTGLGTATHALYGDGSTASGWTGTAAASVTLGSTQPTRTVAAQSGRARSVAFKVSATSGVWELARWEGRVMDVRGSA